MTDYYLIRSEKEVGKGFSDLYLEPFTAKYPDIGYGYLIEIKYLKRSEWSEKKIKALSIEAKQQLLRFE